jgi:hypothetical protein
MQFQFSFVSPVDLPIHVTIIPKVIQKGGLFRSLKFVLFFMNVTQESRENIARAKYPKPITTAKEMLRASIMNLLTTE